MKIWVYTLCYNEMRILPYIVKYWQRYADKVIVYDNGSNDGSKEYLQTFPFIDVRDYVTDGFNDAMNRNIKNSAWKEVKGKGVAFVQVSDLDEVLYSPLNIKEILEKHYCHDVWLSNWHEISSEMFPTNIDNELFHRSDGFYDCPQGQPKAIGWSKSKFILFNPNTVTDSNFEVGSHNAWFKTPGITQYFEAPDIYAFHFDKMGFDYLQYKYAKNAARLSPTNKRNGWGVHYNFNDDKKKSEIAALIKKGTQTLKNL